MYASGSNLPYCQLHEPGLSCRSPVRDAQLPLLRIVCLILATIGGTIPCGAEPAGKVQIAIDSEHVLRTMRGGIGASWHAIEFPMFGNDDGDPWSGSVWGGNPPATNDAAWKSLYQYANWLGLDWCRVELDQRMYEPAKGHFAWNNPEMQALYRILDWAEKNHVDVFLQQQFGNVAWNVYPALRDNPKGVLSSAPSNLDDFADGFAALIDHLVRVKGYHCIKWLRIANEPNLDWASWQGPDGHPLPIKPGLAAVRKALDDKHIDLPISGPDWTDLPDFDAAKIDFDEYIGAYDIHTYMSSFDGELGGDYTLSQAEARIRKWADWAQGHHKPLFLSELGTMVYGWKYSNPGPGSYLSGLKDVSLIIRAIGAGVDGVSRWSYVNRGDLDGQWQLVDTWDISANQLRPQFTPHPNSYYMIALLSRFTAKNSAVLTSSVQGGSDSKGPQVFAVALRSPRGQDTVIVANDANLVWSGEIAFSGLNKGKKFYAYQMTPDKQDKVEVALEPVQMPTVSKRKPSFAITLPAQSVTVYSTYNLKPRDPGVIAEPVPGKF
jgi:hypothetical protein